MIMGVLGAGVVALAAGAAWSPVALATRGSSAAAEVAATAGVTSRAAVYKIDPVHTVALFRIRHAGVGFFWGRFNAGEGEFFIDEANPSNSFFKATIDVSSVDTNSADRDQHLRAADFFNTKQFPTATFESKAFAPTDTPGVFELTGDLTLVGVTKSVTARVEYGGKSSFRGKDVQGFEATFEIKRTDFGLSTYAAPDGGESGGLGNTVRLIVGVEGALE